MPKTKAQKEREKEILEGILNQQPVVEIFEVTTKVRMVRTAVFRIRIPFFPDPDPDQTLFPESGSDSENPDPDP